VIEWGYDQVAGAQVPKWRREIEAQEQAKKEREKAQLEDYIFRWVFFQLSFLCYAFIFLHIFLFVCVALPFEVVWREIEARGERRRSSR
jgi:cell division septal protein FtsQ